MWFYSHFCKVSLFGKVRGNYFINTIAGKRFNSRYRYLCFDSYRVYSSPRIFLSCVASREIAVTEEISRIPVRNWRLRCEREKKEKGILYSRESTCVEWSNFHWLFLMSSLLYKSRLSVLLQETLTIFANVLLALFYTRFPGTFGKKERNCWCERRDALHLREGARVGKASSACRENYW